MVFSYIRHTLWFVVNKPRMWLQQHAQNDHPFWSDNKDNWEHNRFLLLSMVCLEKAGDAEHKAEYRKRSTGVESSVYR